MRRHKEIIILLGLLVAMMGFVLWYVRDRKARNRAAPPIATQPVGPLAPTASPPTVDLTQHDGKTVDFSSGQPVVKNTPEDQAAIAAAKRDMAEALKDVTFEAPKKKSPAP